MVNPIDSMFAGPAGSRLMTHVVAGYPDLQTSRRLITLMAGAGADLVEIQFPFSDPLADGATIMAANQAALEGGITPAACFAMAAALKRALKTPLLLMTYANIPFQMGWKRFISGAAEAGFSGLIIPDLPFDEENGPSLSMAKQHGLYIVPVISPGMATSRLKKILRFAEGFIYVTLRVGITGTVEEIDPRGVKFIETVRRYTSLPVAAGFGISSSRQVMLLRERVEAVVIGSHVINLYNRRGEGAVKEFIRLCKAPFT